MSKQKRTRKQQAEDTKRHIFEVALGMLQEYDFEAIKVRDIVRTAEVSIGTFYNYYNTKLDVFYETYQLADEYFIQTVSPGLTQETARQRILYFFDEYAKYSSEITDLSLTKILYNSNNTFFDRPGSPGMHSVLYDQVLFGLNSGDFRTTSSPEEIVSFFMIAARGLVYNWCTHNGSYALRPAMARYLNRLLLAF